MNAFTLGRVLAPSTRPGLDVDDVETILRDVQAPAERHRLIPAVWSALLDRQLVPATPPSVHEFVARRWPDRAPLELAAAAAYSANRARVDDLLDQATTALAALGDAGIQAAPLKGIDAVLAGRYADPAARTMTDIDILVDAPDVAAAHDVIARLGYGPAPGASAACHQLAAVVAERRAGSIELHMKLTPDRWSDLLDARRALDRAAVPPDGIGWRLARTDSCIHLIAHAQLQDDALRLWRLPLRSLHETALLVAREEDVDWHEVDRRFTQAGQGRALQTHLRLATTIFGVPCPLPLGRRSRARARAVIALDGRATGTLVSQAAFLPQALAADRMQELYAVAGRRRVAVAQVRHAARGSTRRIVRTVRARAGNAGPERQAG